jgi:hypothetical protein
MRQFLKEANPLDLSLHLPTNRRLIAALSWLAMGSSEVRRMRQPG